MPKNVTSDSLEAFCERKRRYNISVCLLSHNHSALYHTLQQGFPTCSPCNFSYTAEPPPIKTFTGQKLTSGSAIKLPQNYCQEYLLVRRCYKSASTVRIELSNFPVLLCYLIFFSHISNRQIKFKHKKYRSYIKKRKLYIQRQIWACCRLYRH